MTLAGNDLWSPGGLARGLLHLSGESGPRDDQQRKKQPPAD
jgi:hypothetical protein